MIQFQVRANSVQQVSGYLETVQAELLMAVMEGVGQSMQGLAAHVVESKLTGSPIMSRSGALASGVMRSPYVRLLTNRIIGRVSSRGKGSSAWYGGTLETGALVKALKGKLMVFQGKDGKVFTYRRREYFRQKRPFMRPALEEYKNVIIERINATVRARLAQKLGG